jgi:hypothetical protein
MVRAQVYQLGQGRQRDVLGKVFVDVLRQLLAAIPEVRRECASRNGKPLAFTRMSSQAKAMLTASA